MPLWIKIAVICDYMMLAAWELNNGNMMIGLFNPPIIKKEFKIPEYIEPAALLILGYPKKGFLIPELHRTERKPPYGYSHV